MRRAPAAECRLGMQGCSAGCGVGTVNAVGVAVPRDSGRQTREGLVSLGLFPDL